MKSIFRKLTEAELDKKDIKILFELSQEKKFNEDDYKSIAKKVGLDLIDVRKRLQVLRGKKILLKDRVSILDQVKIWDGYYIVLVKAAIQPPVIGMETKFPTGWAVADYISWLKQVEKEMGLNLIRHAYTLQGTEWDLLLVVSASSQKEFIAFIGVVAKQGWVLKVWSMTPGEFGQGWVFDPVASPDPEKVLVLKQDVILKKGG